MADPNPLAGMPLAESLANNMNESLQWMSRMWGNSAAAPLPGAEALFGQSPSVPGLPSMLMPTLDPKELEKRIGDLKTVEHWLDMNRALLHTTIQTLEMQRNAVIALQSMAMSTQAGRFLARPAPVRHPMPPRRWVATAARACSRCPSTRRSGGTRCTSSLRASRRPPRPKPSAPPLILSLRAKPRRRRQGALPRRRQRRRLAANRPPASLLGGPVRAAPGCQGGRDVVQRSQCQHVGRHAPDQSRTGSAHPDRRGGRQLGAQLDDPVDHLVRVQRFAER